MGPTRIFIHLLAIFIGFVVVPVFALAFDVGRYLYARQEIGKAADCFL